LTEAQPLHEQKTQIDAFLSPARLARLATADPQTLQPHVVPVWYAWDGESLWISSYSNTRKIRELESNARCSILIDINESEISPQAVLFEGRVELVREPRDFLERMFTHIYERYLGPEGVLEPDPQDWIRDPHNLLIKLKPEKTYTW